MSDRDIEKSGSRLCCSQSPALTSPTTTEHDIEKRGSEDELTTKDKAEDDSDPYLVSFKGSEDPSNPQNWSGKQKWSIVGMMSAMTLLVYAIWYSPKRVAS